jgi:hypothetical protein
VAILNWLVVFVLGRLAGCPEKKTDYRLSRCTSYMFADFWLGAATRKYRWSETLICWMALSKRTHFAFLADEVAEWNAQGRF